MTQVRDVRDVIDITTVEGAKWVTDRGKQFPDLWIENYLGCDMWALPKLIARSVFANPRTAVSSCSATSKSHSAARIGIAFLYLHSPSTVITTAPTFRQVQDILWREIGMAWGGAKVNLGGDLKSVGIQIREDWFAIGLSTDEPEKFQGLHNINVLVIGDEASGLTPAVYTAIENPLSSGNAHLLLIGNPTQPVGNFKDAFNSPLYKTFHISCFDTPNFTHFGITMDDIRHNTWKEKIGDAELPRPYLISPQWVWERYEEWGENNILFQVYCLGQFPDAGVNTLIPVHVIDYAMDTVNIEPKGEKVASLDVSRYGDDETVYMLRQGNKIIKAIAWGHQDNIYSAGRTARLLREDKPLICRIDAVGIGSGTFDILKDNGFDNVEEYNSAEAALDTEIFGNSRAEIYFKVANLLQGNELDLPAIPKLRSQLADIRYRYNKKNQLLIESKEEARSRGVKSPDYADALIMLYKPVSAMLRSKQKVRSFMG